MKQQTKQHTMKQSNAPIRLVILPFEIEAKLSNEYACGGWDKRFKASMTLECEQLDEHGFVVENQTLIQTVRDYFAKSKYQASCEQLCQCIARISHDLMGDRLTRAQVQVFNLTGYTEIEWTKGTSIPPLPFCET
jgi:hypothetical protein